MKDTEENNIEFICEHHSEERMNDFQKRMKKDKIKIEKGDFVKICFKEDDQKEWMWVKVTNLAKQKGSRHMGMLSNKPLLLKYIFYGEPVMFFENEIAEIIKQSDAEQEKV